MEEKSGNIIASVISGVIVAIVATGVNYVITIQVLKSQVDDLRVNQAGLSKDVEQVQEKYWRLEGFLQAKLNYNFKAMVQISNKKKISQESFAEALPILENKPAEAESYLIQQLQFTPAEAKEVLKAPRTQN